MPSLTFFRRPALRGIFLGLTCALAVWLLSQTDLCRGLEDWMLDGCFSWRGQRTSTTRVVLIGIDEPSLRGLGKSYAYISPELAEVVRYAHDQGASAIGVDFLVPQDMSDLPDINTPGAPGDARTMGKAVLDAGNVVLPQRRIENGWQRPLLQWQLQWQKKALDPTRSAFTDPAFTDLSEDGDQFIRRQHLLDDLDKSNNSASPQFALALYARSRNAQITWDDADRPLVGGKPIPVDAEGAMRINYLGPPGTVPVVSFKDVLADARARRGRADMSGAVVIIGVTARSQQDYHATPYANHYARWLASQSRA